MELFFRNRKAGNPLSLFGLEIDGISSRKLDVGLEGSLKNNYQYQGDYAELDEDIGWHDFALRNYDAQIGRWVQADPIWQFATHASPSM